MGWLIIGFMAIAGYWIDNIPPHDRGRKSGDIIYQWNQDKTRIRKYHAFGASTCRPQLYRKIALPFQPRWHEGHKPGELDFCTGQVYYNKKWQYFPSLIDDEEEVKP